jgi:enoyl-CoA hydratase
MPNDLTDPITLPTFETLLFEQSGPIATITLNRPAVLNALNTQLFDDLERAFNGIAQDPSVRAILVTGSGDKAFAAGADIAELAQLDRAATQQKALRGQSVFALIESCPRPVIACVNGFALGGGCELALACTLRVASDTAKLGQPEIKLGLIPGYGGTQRLPRLIGQSAALKLLLTGEIISAAEALRLGLVDEVVPAAELLPRARAIADQIAAQAPLAVSAALEAVHQGMALPLDQALKLEAEIFGRLSETADKKEGVEAFLTKRKPTFHGK